MSLARALGIALAGDAGHAGMAGKRRIRQVDTSNMTYYRWNGWEVYSEYLQGSGGFWDMNGTARRTYLPGLGEAYSAGSASMADYTYWTTDHLGSVRGIYMQDRTPYGRYAYDPYGQTRLEAGLPLNVGFTGHVWDACIQQYFAPFRYYNPAAARWTTRDPLGYIDGPNMYGYVQGEPILHFDKYGLWFDGCTPKEPKDDKKEPDKPEKPPEDPKTPRTPNNENVVKDEVKNVASTVKDAAVEVIFNGTPGLPPGLGEITAAAGAAGGANEIAKRAEDGNKSKFSIIDDPFNGDISGHAGGDLPSEKLKCKTR